MKKCSFLIEWEDYDGPGGACQVESYYEALNLVMMKCSDESVSSVSLADINSLSPGSIDFVLSHSEFSNFQTDIKPAVDFCSDYHCSACDSDGCPIRVAGLSRDKSSVLNFCSVCSFNTGCCNCTRLDPLCNPDLVKGDPAGDG